MGNLHVAILYNCLISKIAGFTLNQTHRKTVFQALLDNTANFGPRPRSLPKSRVSEVLSMENCSGDTQTSALHRSQHPGSGLSLHQARWSKRIRKLLALDHISSQNCFLSCLSHFLSCDSTKSEKQR